MYCQTMVFLAVAATLQTCFVALRLENGRLAHVRIADESNADFIQIADMTEQIDQAALSERMRQ